MTRKRKSPFGVSMWSADMLLAPKPKRRTPAKRTGPLPKGWEAAYDAARANPPQRKPKRMRTFDFSQWWKR